MLAALEMPETGGSTGMTIAVLLAIAGGVAWWYFKK